jgi:hypothetical protein
MKPESTWKGKILSEYSKEELIGIIEEMGRIQDQERQMNKEHFDFLLDLGRRYK